MSTAWMQRRLGALDRRRLLRKVRPVQDGAEPWLAVDGRRLLNLSSNNYLGLAGHPQVRQAASEAARDLGCGAGAARLITGTSPGHEALEEALATFKGAEAALLFNSGYAANTGVIPALAGEGDAVIGDELNHASIIDGCRLSRAKLLTFHHGDVDALEKGLRTARDASPRGHVLVVTDTVFSMDGDLAPLPAIVETCERYEAVLMIDEAHATGCLGPQGKGAAAHFHVESRVQVAMGTLSKALGSFGAFVAGDTVLREYLVNTARSFIFTTALPPTVIAASAAALRVLGEHPELPCRLQENGRYLREGLQRLGFDTLGSETQIVPVKVTETSVALEFALLLQEEGVYAVAIRSPAVPIGGARIRASVMALHTRGDMDLALDAFERAGRAVGLI